MGDRTDLWDFDDSYRDAAEQWGDYAVMATDGERFVGAQWNFNSATRYFTKFFEPRPG